jgi:hypothetical protein
MTGRLLDGRRTLFIDQHGTRIWAHTVKELRESVGSGRVFKIYSDKLDGRVMHCGYGIGKQWFAAYRPLEIEAAR